MFSLDSTAVFAALLALAGQVVADSVSVTPHTSYSSSVGVLGCKIDTNRVAYWPGSVDCTNICVKLTYGSRSVNLLRIDESAGAYDISYDAWVYLQTGNSATTDPLVGGGITMEYEDVDASDCADLIHTSDSKLPLSGSNSMNFVSGCISDSSSWVGQNYVLYNILDPICSYGYDEECTLDLDVSNQPSCPHTLGLTTSLTTAPVYNIEYETGITVNAATGETVSASVALAADSTDDDSTADSSDSSDSSSTSTNAAISTVAAAASIVAVVVKPSSASSTASTATATTSSVVTSLSSTYIAPKTTVATVVTTAVDTTTAAETTTTAQLSSNAPGIFIATSETANTPSAVSTYSSSSSSSSSSSISISFNTAPRSSSFATTVVTAATTAATAVATTSVTTAGNTSTPSGSTGSIDTKSRSATADTAPSSGKTAETTFSVAKVSATKAVSTSGTANATGTSSSSTTTVTSSASKGAVIHLWVAIYASSACFALALLG